MLHPRATHTKVSERRGRDARPFRQGRAWDLLAGEPVCLILYHATLFEYVALCDVVVGHAPNAKRNGLADAGIIVRIVRVWQVKVTGFCAIRVPRTELIKPAADLVGRDGSNKGLPVFRLSGAQIEFLNHNVPVAAQLLSGDAVGISAAERLNATNEHLPDVV